MCTPVSSTTGRQHLRSAARHDRTIPRSRLARYGSRSFATSGPSIWNSLPLTFRDMSLTLCKSQHDKISGHERVSLRRQWTAYGVWHAVDVAGRSSFQPVSSRSLQKSTDCQSKLQDRWLYQTNECSRHQLMQSLSYWPYLTAAQCPTRWIESCPYLIWDDLMSSMR